MQKIGKKKGEREKKLKSILIRFQQIDSNYSFFTGRAQNMNWAFSVLKL